MAIYANCSLGSSEIKLTRTPRLYVGKNYVEVDAEQYEKLLVYFDYDSIGHILHIFEACGGVIPSSRRSWN